MFNWLIRSDIQREARRIMADDQRRFDRVMRRREVEALEAIAEHCPIAEPTAKS